VCEVLASLAASKPAIVPTFGLSAAAVDVDPFVVDNALFAAAVSGLLCKLPRNDERKPENSSEDRRPSPSAS
jgi:hypothetical protein